MKWLRFMKTIEPACSVSPFLPARARPRRSLVCPVHAPPRVSRPACKLRSMVACTLSLHLQAAAAKGVVAHRESSRRQPRQIGVARRSPKRWWVNARRRRRLAARSLGRWLQRRRCSTAAARKSRRRRSSARLAWRQHTTKRWSDSVWKQCRETGL
jgi:hypothetical protein